MANRRKPVALKLLAGNPGKRPLPSGSPPPMNAPGCPPHVVGEARAEWERITKELATLNILTELDTAALAAYCTLYARWMEAERKVAEEGATVKVHGQIVPNPYLGIANTALKMLRPLTQELGLSPASRIKLQIIAPLTSKPASKWDGILNVREFEN